MKYKILLSLVVLLAGSSLLHAEDSTKYVPEILVVKDASEVDELKSKGVIVWNQREDMLLCAIPETLYYGDIMKVKGNKNVKISLPAKPAMDVAKNYFDAYKIHLGEGLDKTYTGRGVVVGFCDSGFDPNHINFLDKDGNSRVRRLVYYNETAGIRKVMDTPEQIKAWTTDKDSENHATHVAGILAGSYDANGYSGMAPDAEIVACTAQLYDAAILSACEDIVEYAKMVNKPAVINLSLGSYNGPHDGTSLFCRYIDLIAQEAIVCLAAGNEATKTNSYRMYFTDENREWRVRVHSADWAQFDMYGLTDVWSADDRPVKMIFHVYDEAINGTVYSVTYDVSNSGQSIVISSETDSEFAKYFTGEIAIEGEVSDLNGRWVTTIMYDTHTDEPSPISSGNWARYTIGVEIQADPGVVADITCDSQYSRFVAWPGYSYPTADLSVSDLATANNVICVGMYNNRKSIPSISGGEHEYNFEPFQVSGYSSYGNLIDGRILPHTVAPGAGIVSSANRHSQVAYPATIPMMSAVAENNGISYYWMGNTGTSMSCPYVAGTIACWLEASPNLSSGDVKELLARTNLTDVPEMDNPRNGLGWFRPYQAMLQMPELSQITTTRDDSHLKIYVEKDAIKIENPLNEFQEIMLISAAGEIYEQQIVNPNSMLKIDVSNYQRGVYVVRAANYAKKIVK